ncbi:MAG: M23 family metallopeptidase [Ginsengibacter sp.]
MIDIFFFKATLHKPFLFFFACILAIPVISQVFPPRVYPQGYFIYPVVARVGLAANFGELRPNHYHMGLDCRTDQVVNKKILAAADGYIAKVSVAPFGFGQAIYINHPNGLTTLYGHLNSFYPALEKYVIEQQYLRQSWQVSLDIPKELFPVTKGQLIALSGNTGGSQGPHCHFEIRDTKSDKVLNPLLFDFPLPDKVPPSIVRLYMYDRCISTYRQIPKQLPIKNEGHDYTTSSNIIPVNTDKISFGISANDKLSGSNNPNGIYSAVIYLDDQQLSGFLLDSISYDETRYLNAHIDYKTKMSGGPYIQHLSRLPGYPQGVYKDVNGDGVIELKDNDVHSVKIVVKDANGNSSILIFKIKKGIINEKGRTPDSSQYYDQKEFFPGFVNVYETNNFQLYLPPATLYDSLPFTYSAKKSESATAYSDVITILSGLIPAQDFFTVKIKPNRTISETSVDRILIKQSWGAKNQVIKAEKEGEWYKAKFRMFGNFELIADTIPPVIGGFADGANLSHAKSIVFTPRDNNEELKNFRAELDGQWLRFTNDKGKTFIYYFDEKCGRGKHELKISIDDEAGNRAERVIHFTR